MKIKVLEKEEFLGSDLKQLEEYVGHKFPGELKTFFKKYNGANVEPNIFEYSDSLQCNVNKFISLKEIVNEIKFIDNLDKFTIPVAIAEGGNYVIVNVLENGKVYFWDHEEPEIKYPISDNILDFLDQLEPFSVNDIELKKEDIISSWIDPDFLKSIKKD